MTATHGVPSDGSWCCAITSFSAAAPPRPLCGPQDWAEDVVAAAMDAFPAAAPAAFSSPYALCSSSYSKFNFALGAGLLKPMSPPPLAPLDKSRSSPTLFDKMTNEQGFYPRSPEHVVPPPMQQLGRAVADPEATSPQDRQLLLQDRVAEIIGNCSPGNQLNDPESGDVHLTLSSMDGLTVSLNVHRHILVGHSRFFAAKLRDRWSKQQRSLPYIVEISDCDDVEIYVETLCLMYCKDLRRRLMREDVSKVLGILKVPPLEFLFALFSATTASPVTISALFGRFRLRSHSMRGFYHASST